MMKLRVNIKFLINKIPTNYILFKRNVVNSPSCEMCRGNYPQTYAHLLTECTVTTSSRRIAELWDQIVQKFSSLKKWTVIGTKKFFNNKKMKSQLLLNPFSHNLMNARLDYKDKNNFDIIDLTQTYLIVISDSYKEHKK